jgi:ribosomal protein L32
LRTLFNHQQQEAMKNELNELIKRWETRVEVLKQNQQFQHQVIKARINNEIKAIRRCKKDLKAEIQADDQRKKHHDDFSNPLMNCPDCGKFQNFGHVCEPKTNTDNQ